MANLPAAVQRQLDNAEALLAQSQPPQPSLEIAGLPAEEVPPAPAVAPPPPAPTPPVEDTWEKRYKTLQGLFNAEVPKLQKANQTLNDQLQAAIARMDKLSQAPAPAPAPQAEPPRTLDPKDIEDFGKDLVEMVQRQIGSVTSDLVRKVDAIVADVDKRLSQLEQESTTTSQTVATTAEELFFGRLSDLVPDWEALNGDADFHAWLLEEDPVYGVPRQAALTGAQRKLDAPRAAKVFNAYKALIPQEPRVDPLDKQVSPRTTGASNPPVPQEKPVISQQAVEAFYRDVAQGKYRGREKQQQANEAAINAALAEGRIR